MAIRSVPGAGRRSGLVRRWHAAAVALAALGILVGLAPARAGEPAYHGFGATTRGGAGHPVVRVTNLNDSGPGSLREALSQGHRTVVFDVAGDIELQDFLYVRGPYVTIDGFTAPAPGITLRNRGLIIRGNRGGHDIIVRGIRVRNASIDGIQVAAGAYNVVIDHVSVAGSGDGNIDITEDSRDVTVSWSIIGEAAGESKNMLLKYGISRLSLHHNLLVMARQRNPQVRIDDAGTPATDTTLDMRNNVVWDWTAYGTIVWYGPRANIVDNYYAAPSRSLAVKRRALIVCTGECNSGDPASASRAYVAGNFSGDGLTAEINVLGTERAPFPAPPVPTTDACAAAQEVVAGAGVRPLDAIDAGYIARITLPACSVVASTVTVSPAALQFTASVGGTAPAPQALSLSGARLAVSADVSAPWITVTPASGLVPSRLNVGINPAGLAPGSYAGAVTVNAPGAANSPVRVPVSLTVEPAAGGEQTVEVQLEDGADDASESTLGRIRTRELAMRVGRGNTLALRFASIPVPRGAVVRSAVLRLFGVTYTDEDIQIEYRGEADDHSAPIGGERYGLTSRVPTSAFVSDAPPPWRRGEWNDSPDLRSIVQEIVSRPGWRSGNAMTLFLIDDGSTRVRLMGSVETSQYDRRGAVLRVTYTLR